LNFHVRRARALYNAIVDYSVVRALGAAAAAAACCIAPALGQQGATVQLPVRDGTVVRLQMRSGNLVVRTWNRDSVQIAAPEAVRARLFGPVAVERALRGGALPVPETSVVTPAGPLTLVAEQFSLDPSLAPRDGVQILAGEQNGTVTLTVPATTALLVTQVARGSIRIERYRGEFLATLHNGPMQLVDAGGAGYAQAARGTIRVLSSTFDRIRARTAIGNIVFQDCSARQIEVSSIDGSIAYDDGTFVPGLARFETQSGNVALGIAGTAGVQIGARSGSGKVLESLDGGASVSGTASDTQAILNGGGPVVTATSGSGNVYLYRGSFKDRPALQQRWRPAARAIKARTCAKPRCRV
jgi:hypothetical protein